VSVQSTFGVIGHVDHGKTALVRALTGIETDRLKEEQERGLSIVLGFSYLETPAGAIDLIDVPGHEDFIRTMISGATGIDGVLLVVAANEGVMPQTQEHLDIAGLLGVQRGLVVITKTDLVSADQCACVSEEIQRYLEGSFLEAAPVVHTSAVAGEGLDGLRAELTRLAERPVLRPSGEQFFLPIDRAFAMRGFGLVATGTLRGGVLRANDTVEILPGGGTATVRALQVHNRSVEDAGPGQRVGVNLRNLKREDLRRGDVLASPGLIQPTRRLDVELRLLGSRLEALRNGAAVRLLLGTTDVIAKVRLLDRAELPPGDTGLAQLRCQGDVATHRAEPFIIRGCSPATTIGGGRILEVGPPRHRRFDASVTGRLRSTADGDPAEMIRASLIEAGGRGVDAEALRARLALSREQMQAAVEAAHAVSAGERRIVDREALAELKSVILSEVERYHQSNPRERGIAAASLRSRLASRVDDDVFQHAVDELVASQAIRSASGVLASAGFDPLGNLPPRDRELAAELEEVFRSAGLAPPPLDGVLRGDKTKRDLFRLLSQIGRLVPLRTYHRDSNLVLHETTLEDVRERLRESYPYPREFAVSEVRDLLGATRKYVVPLMEHLDATGVTIRTGNVRRLRQR